MDEKMKLEFLGIKDSGKIDSERLELRALTEVQIGQYGLFCALRSEDGITSFLRAAYWFPDGLVKSGDIVEVYTRDGDDRSLAREDAPTTHVYFWSRKAPLWDDERYAPVIFRLSEWRLLRLAEQLPLNLGDTEKV
jgi:hypothetical protein